jgi:hypothetical protein
MEWLELTAVKGWCRGRAVRGKLQLFAWQQGISAMWFQVQSHSMHLLSVVFFPGAAAYHPHMPTNYQLPAGGILRSMGR